MSNRLLRVLVAAVAALGLAVAIPGPAAAYPPDPPSVNEAQAQLAAITVSAPQSDDGYSRDRFPHWRAQEGNCNTREVVLRRDGAGVETGNDCYPTSGRWYSVYDQIWVSDPADVDIDHMVPLAEAWRSGARSWTDAKRADFANDLSRGQLIAVSGSSNSAKSDKDPAEWRPDNTNWWCYYSRHWIDVKHDWALTIDAAEKSALADMLATC
ncbi:HNH endonuclease family protein [Haloactinopolyspora sp.]|uniref:HNH endonuclease family protein n=1 Tax=Haloactinopolyspora sp. TaxID=1966353 RepID=UPI0026257379|nr:HNH endonuclease family protein [Haloactinopolyspora sp.]